MNDVAAGEASWEQGDVCLSIDGLPVILSDDGDADFVEVQGVVIVTQTCDLVRDPAARPRFQVAGLVKATPEEIEQIRRFGKPQYAYVPQCAEMGLVADLDIVASYDKKVLAGWTQLPAPREANSRREFGYAAGRHRSRVAFPDRWAAELDGLRSWLRSRSSKGSPEGLFASSIEQMRIIANDVDCPSEAEILCLIPTTVPPALREEWNKKMVPKLDAKIAKEWGCDVTFKLVTTTEITAADYLSSLRLDFDALSRAA